jgi:rSAM/selenodomain-associated transferase 2
VQNKSISVIIPSFNEERRIRACIESAQRINPLEVIVVDGGSTDRTCEIAQEAGAIVIRSSKGRGIQMNKGASFAKGKILLFLHADTIITNDMFKVKNVKKKIFNEYIGGFFRLKFDDNSLSTRLVEIFANLRARLFSLPYGDQAIFIKRDVFKKVGGFREYPFLEDIDFVMRARKFGRLKYIPLHVIASSRRLKKGYLLSPIFVSLKNVVIALLFILGVGPSNLAKLYK